MKNQKTAIKEPQFPLLATKLFVPPPRPDQVQRSLLIKRLNDGISRKLSLISAPAGFGKTSLISEWIAQSEMPIAWISLGKSDSDPVHFTHYLIAALRNIHPSIGESALSQLEATQRPVIEPIIVNLIKEMTDLAQDLVLILDDYHSIDAEDIHGIVGTLLDFLPAHIHLVIATRVDPPLPLARLRVSNQLSELRTADLCFTSDETTTFFNQVMNLQLSSNDISILESRTEGWIAGLQLAAISMRDREDLPSFIDTFAGDDRHIVDYLVEEVLNLQSEQVQNFLLQTSILSRLSESLCNFVTEEKESQKILDELEKANLFVVPLDDKRHWYRYHHLFAELLQQRLHQSKEDLVNELHTRASKWYEEKDFKDEAVNHALVAQNFERAAQLISEFIKTAWEYNIRMLEWHKMLPVEYIHKDPELSFFNAHELYEDGHHDAAEENLKVAEGLINSISDSELTSHPDNKESQTDDFAELQGKIAVIRAFMAFSKNKLPEVINFSKKAKEHLRHKSSVWRPMASIALGLGYFSQGETVKAIQNYEEAADEGKRIEKYYIYQMARLRLADVKISQGDLSSAIGIYEDLLKTAENAGLLQSPMMGWLYNSWSEVLSAQNHINEALQYIQQGVEFSEQINEAAMIADSYLSLGRILFLKGDINGVEAVLQKMESKAQDSDFRLHISEQLEDLKARIWLQKGRVKPALNWMQELDLVKSGNFDQISKSRLLLFSSILFAHGRYDKALEIVQPMIETAENAGWVAERIEALLIQAKIFKSMDELTAAISSIKKAVSLAEPGGYVAIFVGEGPLIAELLEILLDQNSEIPRAFVNKLLSAFRLTKLIKTENEFVERLSERELEILRLIAAGLPNKTITEELFISMSTVKTHLRNIYSKLNVNSRTQAAAKAKELNLL